MAARNRSFSASTSISPSWYVPAAIWRSIVAPRAIQVPRWATASLAVQPSSK